MTIKRREAGIRRGLFALGLVACLGCDRLTKELAQEHLAGTLGVPFASGLLRLELAENPGAFLSLGASLPPALREAIFLVFVPLVLLAVVASMLRAGLVSRTQSLGLALLSGGGLGNWLDRVLHDGVVIDFLSLGVGPLRTGIFNLADVAILVGIALVLMGGRSVAPGPEPESG